MIRGFQVKNMIIAILAGVIIAQNTHVPGISPGELIAYVIGTAMVAWICIEELQIKWEKRHDN